MWDSLIVITRIIVLVYVGLVILLAGCQRQMIYYPSKAREADLLVEARLSGMEPWRNEQGELIGWRAASDNPDRDVMIVFHGNAGYALHRTYLVYGFDSSMDVYLFEYPGYGARDGKPSEKSIFKAAEEALLQARTERSGRIFLAGESLGSGVAAHLAGAHPELVAGALMITPFSSLVDVARSHYPYLPVRLLLRDKYENAKALKTYRGPIAVLLAGEDEVIPVRFGQKLYDGYEGPKQRWVQVGRRHNTLDYSPGSPWWKEVARFLTEEGTADER
jgi:hypothetical protein